MMDNMDLDLGVLSFVESTLNVDEGSLADSFSLTRRITAAGNATVEEMETVNPNNIMDNFLHQDQTDVVNGQIAKFYVMDDSNGQMNYILSSNELDEATNNEGNCLAALCSTGLMRGDEDHSSEMLLVDQDGQTIATYAGCQALQPDGTISDSHVLSQELAVSNGSSNDLVIDETADRNSVRAESLVLQLPLSAPLKTKISFSKPKTQRKKREKKVVKSKVAQGEEVLSDEKLAAVGDALIRERAMLRTTFEVMQKRQAELTLKFEQLQVDGKKHGLGKVMKELGLDVLPSAITTVSGSGESGFKTWNTDFQSSSAVDLASGRPKNTFWKL